MLKYFWRITLLVLLSVSVIITLFLTRSPEFGGKYNSADRERYQKSALYQDGKFINETPTSLDMGFADMMKTMKEFIAGVPDSEPGFELPIEKVDSMTLAGNTDATRLIWFGHSAFLLQMDGLNILIDPMFGKVPAPHPWLGKNRYSKELPIEIEKLQPLT